MAHLNLPGEDITPPKINEIEEIKKDIEKIKKELNLHHRQLTNVMEYFLKQEDPWDHLPCFQKKGMKDG